ncbi:MAG: hypothetical protein NT170_03720 [Candidatus Moranbacteria bacterium]|nr:hypothetical protein [Candidatus Moranbacteria bacterium]
MKKLKKIKTIQKIILLLIVFLLSDSIVRAYSPYPPRECRWDYSRSAARMITAIKKKIILVKKDYSSNHQGFRESLINDIVSTSGGFGATCKDVVGYWVYTILPDINPKPKVITKNPEEVACKKQGGQWGLMGLSGEYVCNLPATDAGEECTKDSECQGACLGDNKLSSDPHPSTGECSKWTIVLGCRYYFLDNGHQGEICMD